MNALAAEMLKTMGESIAQLRARISDVDYAPTDGETNPITFRIDGQLYMGQLRGRNEDLMLGFGAESDSAVALRVFLDGDAVEVDPA